MGGACSSSNAQKQARGSSEAERSQLREAIKPRARGSQSQSRQTSGSPLTNGVAPNITTIAELEAEGSPFETPAKSNNLKITTGSNKTKLSPSPLQRQSDGVSGSVSSVDNTRLAGLLESAASTQGGSFSNLISSANASPRTSFGAQGAGTAESPLPSPRITTAFAALAPWSRSRPGSARTSPRHSPRAAPAPSGANGAAQTAIQANRRSSTGAGTTVMKFGRRSSLNMEDVDAMMDHEEVAPDGMLRLPALSGSISSGTRRGSIPAVLDGDTIKFASLPQLDAARASQGMSVVIAEEEEREHEAMQQGMASGLSSSMSGPSGQQPHFPRTRHGSLPMHLIYAHAFNAQADMVPQIERNINVIQESNEQAAPEGKCELEVEAESRKEAIARLKQQSLEISKALEDGTYLEHDVSSDGDSKNSNNSGNNGHNKRGSVSRTSVSRRSSLPTVLEGHRSSNASVSESAEALRRLSRSRNPQQAASPRQTHAEMMAAAREQIAKEKAASKIGSMPEDAKAQPEAFGVLKADIYDV